MKKYKIYSFDLWMTLIRSHPLYKEYRTYIYSKDFNPLGYSFDQVKHIIKQTESFCNKTNELVGLNINRREIICMILNNLGNNVKYINTKQLELIEKKSDELILQYPPQLYDKDTKNVIEKLSYIADLFIISNTGYVTGEQLTYALNHLGIKQYFKKIFYSDEVGYSKPSLEMFRTFFSYLGPIQMNMQILHVGDNIVTDVDGPTKCGISTFQINSNNKSILNLL